MLTAEQRAHDLTLVLVEKIMRPEPNMNDSKRVAYIESASELYKSAFEMSLKFMLRHYPD